MELSEAHRLWNIDGDNLMRGWEIIEDQAYMKYLAHGEETTHHHYPPLEMMALGVFRGVLLAASEGVRLEGSMVSTICGIYMLGVEHGSKGVTLTPCTDDIEEH